MVVDHKSIWIRSHHSLFFPNLGVGHPFRYLQKMSHGPTQHGLDLKGYPPPKDNYIRWAARLHQCSPTPGYQNFQSQKYRQGLPFWDPPSKSKATDSDQQLDKISRPRA